MRALRRSVARARGEDLRTREQLVAHARLTASAEPVYTGYGTLLDRQTIARCRHDFRSGDLVHLLLFTRDGGMHSSGWWKNPDYERCWHLSLSFLDAETAESAPHDHGEARRWCELFFGDHTRYLWIEPPFSDHGRARDIWHYRLFVAPDWRLPILPRGEVYSRELTEAGWKSWSDLHGEPRSRRAFR